MARMVPPLVILLAVPLALLVLLARQPRPPGLEPLLVVAFGWGAWALGLAVAITIQFLPQLTRVSTTRIEPPLRSFLSALRRRADPIAVADIERIELRKGRVRCYLLHTRLHARRWPEVICEYNVEDFARFSAALKQVFPHLDSW